MVVATLFTVATAPAASASTTMTFTGRGFGHGRGLSQYGAEGHARNFGWNRDQILDHYYGGTRGALIGDTANPPALPFRRIRLQRMQGKITAVKIANGSLRLNDGSIPLPAGTKAIQIARHGTASSAPLKFRTGTKCGGSWSGWTVTGESVLDIGKDRPDSDDPDDLLAVCPVSGASYDLTSNQVVWYPGSIRSHSVDGTLQTLNLTTVEKQLRGVVPNEMPASWTPAALQAQSVAARSYSLSGDTRWLPYGDTCDTIFCQVYVGWFSTRSTHPTMRSTHPNTDAAIAATEGLVRAFTSNNRIARTEFSSTSGGYTAGGTFPAVPDPGDSISPVHTWTATVSVAPLESAYGGGGRLTRIEVTKRNGLGAGGGRVLEARLVFSNGVRRTVSGNTIRSRLGLRSDWFFPSSNCSPGGSYIHAVHELFVNRPATGGEIDRWCASVQRGDRAALTDSLSVSREWAGVQIEELYLKILGRSADGPGLTYWLGRVQAGLRIEDIAAYFYGGSEYFQRSGQTHEGFVRRLYVDLLGRKADSGGLSHWVGELDSGRLDRTGVATNFYASIESRRSRVQDLYRQILGRSADSGGLAYWADQLRTIGDVRLASFLAASREFYNRSTP